MTAILSKLARILRRSTPLSALTLLVFVLSPRQLQAQGRAFWQEGGVVLCAETWSSSGLAAVPDDSGGAIAAWADSRGEYESVWAQRVNRDGDVLWQQNGVLLRDSTRTPSRLSAVSDSRGGMVVLWAEYFVWPNTMQVSAQRVDSAGNVLWGPNGVIVVGDREGRYDFYPAMTTDGRGGTIVAWVKKDMGLEREFDTLCVQRLDSLGRFRWGPNGVVVHADTLAGPSLCADESGGAFLVWTVTGETRSTVLVQHVDSVGNLAWPQPGMPVCSVNAGAIQSVRVAGGTVIAFGTHASIRAQRLDPQGVRLWGNDGKLVCAVPGYYWRVTLEADSLGTFWAWTEKRDSLYDVYAQTLDEGGNRQLESLGVRVGTVGSSDGRGVSALGDHKGRLMLSWPSRRNGDWDLIAQKLDRQGSLCWGDSGLAVADDPRIQGWEPCLTTDSRGGAIVVWGYAHGVNAQRIGDVVGTGGSDLASSQIDDVHFWPNPARGRVMFDVRPRGRRVELLQVADATGRNVRTLRGCAVGQDVSRFVWDGKDDRLKAVPTGVYLVRCGPHVLESGKFVLVRD